MEWTPDCIAERPQIVYVATSAPLTRQVLVTHARKCDKGEMFDELGAGDGDLDDEGGVVLDDLEIEPALAQGRGMLGQGAGREPQASPRQGVRPERRSGR
ncbi:hypothetical protein AB0I10_32460 [Streptomyces sp. NPDC050636]|uniref:hypothetical protein n=1 Tax=Streptomyces sp. NPDC050636 TaxID=3154510 RepID=UPI003436F5B7